MDLAHLRQKHPRLIYEGFNLLQVDKDLVLTFKLTLEPDLKFAPTLKIKNLPPEILEQVNDQKTLDPTLERLFFQLGLAEIPSYFKAACPAEVVIRHQGQIETAALDFWQDLLIRGLGEFYYQNKIDFTPKNFLQVKSELVGQPENLSLKKNFKNPGGSKILIPVGGGKDSATVLGMIEERRLPYDVLLLAPHAPAAKKIALLLQKEGFCQRIIEVERSIDPKLLELNRQGYFNGHTPFSAYLAFLSSAIAYLFGQEKILLGNEASSEEENLIYLGQKINHQYSKSLEFEKKFQSYSRDFLFPKVQEAPQYLSLLRSLSELEITQKLCALAKKDQRFTEILHTFKSCNVAQQKDAWCHNCPKCAFVFTMLSAYLDEEVVSREIFQENLLNKAALKQTFLDLAGFGQKKPFECVGTFAEVRQALTLNYQKNPSPNSFLREIQQKITALEMMEKLSQKSILILGMGREGMSTLTFLRQHFPHKKIAVADEQNKELPDSDLIVSYFGPDYLDKLDQYELIIKTAGIPLQTPEIQEAVKKGTEVLSNTQIFFALSPSWHIIGITGTKGKSTTSKLLHEILQTTYPDTVLLGNIGAAPLSKLEQIQAETLIVAELSCHQLAELEVSPHVAIVLDIKEEHLDYYKDFKSYFQAKSAIARYQKSNDYLIYNPDLTGAKQMAELSSAKKLTHSLQAESGALVCQKDKKLFYQNEAIINVAEIPLMGEHNLYNVMPALIAAKLFAVTKENIQKAIKAFNNLPHRLQLVAEIAGVKYYDDSIAVNPHAAIMAIKSFPKNSVLLLAGGYERNQDFQELVEVMAEYQVKALFALPTTGERLLKMTQDKFFLSAQLVDNVQQAVALAKEQAHVGDIVLLSPASASYNSFANYEERGAAFAKAVKES